jgi:2-polyprenyl-3-methyl-5-hydroxy-6-metoxy-1,4-benzoquinol methylase
MAREPRLADNTGRTDCENVNPCAQSTWDGRYAELVLAERHPPQLKWLAKHVVPAKPGERFLELGCFPGQFMPFFGRLGYELHGVDLTPRVERDLPEWLRSLGLGVGRFRRLDVREVPDTGAYDIVASFGLVEHFDDWEEVVRMHALYVRRGGMVIITMPNFAYGLQRAFHAVFDRTNYLQHNRDAMVLRGFVSALETAGCEVSAAEFFGDFELWLGHEREAGLRRYLKGAARRTARLWRWVPNLGRFTCPALGAVAIRTSEPLP